MNVFDGRCHKKCLLFIKHFPAACVGKAATVIKKKKKFKKWLAGFSMGIKAGYETADAGCCDRSS